MPAARQPSRQSPTSLSLSHLDHHCPLLFDLLIWGQPPRPSHSAVVVCLNTASHRIALLAGLSPSRIESRRQIPDVVASVSASPMATQSDDPKGFYGYLFSDDKTATKTLDALLRAIALYIVRALSCPSYLGPLKTGASSFCTDLDRLVRSTKSATRLRKPSPQRSLRPFTRRSGVTMTVRPNKFSETCDRLL